VTTPDEAREQADLALAKATRIKERGVTIAEKWKQSQRDNNFRQMLRQIGKGAVTDGSG
jgi:hypothetical protein